PARRPLGQLVQDALLACASVRERRHERVDEDVTAGAAEAGVEEDLRLRAVNEDGVVRGGGTAEGGGHRQRFGGGGPKVRRSAFLQWGPPQVIPRRGEDAVADRCQAESDGSRRCPLGPPAAREENYAPAGRHGEWRNGLDVIVRTEVAAGADAEE